MKRSNDMQRPPTTQPDVEATALSARKSGEAKIDPITALQEGIAMFEALRGLRDAVAPESGNLGNNNMNNRNNSSSEQQGAAASTTTEPDVEELWQAYCSGDESVIRMVQTSRAATAANNPSNTTTTTSTFSSTTFTKINTRDEFVAWHSKMEREKDAVLVETLAAAVLEKSDQIDDALQHVPGLHRTRAEQLRYMEELIVANAAAADKLEAVYQTAVLRRDACRRFVRSHTSVALGIDEEE